MSGDTEPIPILGNSKVGSHQPMAECPPTVGGCGKSQASNKCGNKLSFTSSREVRSCVMWVIEESSLRASPQPTAVTDFFNSLVGFTGEYKDNHEWFGGQLLVVSLTSTSSSRSGNFEPHRLPSSWKSRIWRRWSHLTVCSNCTLAAYLMDVCGGLPPRQPSSGEPIEAGVYSFSEGLNPSSELMGAKAPPT